MTETQHKLNAALREAVKGRISRRDFIQLALVSGVSLAAANAMIGKARADEPKKGGTFKIGVGHGATTDSMDPGTYPDQFTGTALWGTLANSLTEIDADGNVVGDIAESFESSDGAKKWVFKVRKGVTFHDGKPVTADDVVASLTHHRSENSKSAAKSLLKEIVTLKSDGPDTVVFELSGGNADFPYLLSDYHLAMYPSEGGKIQWEKGIGAGPYVLKSFEPGVKMTAERNPNYFGTTYFDGIELLSIIDVAARTNAYLSGEVHFIDRADLKTIDMLKNAPDTELYNVSGTALYSAPMLVDVAPFDKLEVRQAIKWAINRQELVDKILYGYGSPGNDNMLAPSLKYAIQPEPVYTYDPEKAKSLLKKAGMENLKVDLSASDAAFPGGVDAALLMADQAKAAGIEINVVREPNDSYWDNVWIKKPWCQCYWGGRPTADSFLSISMAADAAWNDTKWKNPRFNELLVAARAETDEAKRQAMYAECQQLMHDDGGQVVLMFNNYVGALNNAIGHNEFNTDFDHDGGYMYERWWMA